MFVSQHVPLRISLAVAQARLVKLAASGELDSAAQTAYEHGSEQVLRIGPSGHASWPSKLVRALFLDPVYRDSTVTIGMRWEAAGMSGTLFPVLDANILVAPVAGDTATLALEGSYRPPFGDPGASLDHALLNRVATATIQTMLREVAVVLTSPAEDNDPTDKAAAPLAK
jgi:hypothetical protein